ncbi:MAG TPA: YafY family protein [Actinopolymorphaceae bacterium]
MDTPARLLRLLAMFTTRPSWNADELADRLEVTARTVRRDVARLRRLGYPVEADPGVAGGYRLGPGGRLPPLLLDDDEAVALAVGLRLASTTAVSGVRDAAVAASAKLDSMLPSRLRERVEALQVGTVQMPGPHLPAVDADVLLALARACRRSEGLEFRYVDNAGQETRRRVEPLRVVHTGRRWYLVARDRDRDAWRTFRVDRIAGPIPTGRRHTFVAPPDPVALVSEGAAVLSYAIQARLRVAAPAEEVTGVVPPMLGVVEADGAEHAIVRIAADDLAPLGHFVSRLPYDVEVLEPAELRTWLADLGRKLLRHRATPTR